MIPVKPLPYAADALEPGLSGTQVRLHHGRLYRRYIERTNSMTDGRWTRVEEAVNEAVSRNDQALFNQAAQAWSHQLYFDSMVPGARGPGGRAADLLGPGFVRRWTDAAESVFGSGWVWLVVPHGPGTPAPVILTTDDADLPDPRAGRRVMVMDVWEHAYYCQYPGQRAEYARVWCERLADWARLTAAYPS